MIETFFAGWAAQLRAEQAHARACAGCTCSVEHTVTKLGHTRACAYFGTVVVSFPTKTKPGCFADHADDTPHNFNWATYDDETSSTGVCSCGLSEMSHAMATWP